MALDSEEGRKALLDRLGKEPFARLAGELGVSERELVDYLLSLSDEGEPDDQPWWPEVLARLLRGVPIRDVAWIFRQPSASLRRAIEREGLDTARVGADEIAVPRTSDARSEHAKAPPDAYAESDRPVIELPMIEPPPDPAWSTWAPIDSLVEEPEGARPVAEAAIPRATLADFDFPPRRKRRSRIRQRASDGPRSPRSRRIRTPRRTSRADADRRGRGTSVWCDRRTSGPRSRRPRRSRPASASVGRWPRAPCGCARPTRSTSRSSWSYRDARRPSHPLPRRAPRGPSAPSASGALPGRSVWVRAGSSWSPRTTPCPPSHSSPT